MEIVATVLDVFAAAAWVWAFGGIVMFIHLKNVGYGLDPRLPISEGRKEAALWPVFLIQVLLGLFIEIFRDVHLTPPPTSRERRSA